MRDPEKPPPLPGWSWKGPGGIGCLTGLAGLAAIAVSMNLDMQLPAVKLLMGGGLLVAILGFILFQIGISRDGKREEEQRRQTRAWKVKQKQLANQKQTAPPCGLTLRETHKKNVYLVTCGRTGESQTLNEQLARLEKGTPCPICGGNVFRIVKESPGSPYD